MSWKNWPSWLKGGVIGGIIGIIVGVLIETLMIFDLYESFDLALLLSMPLSFLVYADVPLSLSKILPSIIFFLGTFINAFIIGIVIGLLKGLSWKILKRGLKGAGIGFILGIIFLSISSIVPDLFYLFIIFGIPWSFFILYILRFVYFGGDPAIAGTFFGLIGITIGIAINGFIVGLIKGLEPDQRKILYKRFLKILFVLIILIFLIFLSFLLWKAYALSIGCGCTKTSEYELRIYDSQGRVTGVVNGEIKEEIPDSAYYEYSKGFDLFEPNGTYATEFFGLTEGCYRYNPQYDLGWTLLDARNIPISPGATHRYYFDWENLDKEEVILLIDENNDKIFEKNITSDRDISCREFLLKTGKISHSKILLANVIFIILNLILVVIALIFIILIIKIKEKK